MPTPNEKQDQQTDDATVDVKDDQEQQAEIAAMFDDSEPADTSTAPADSGQEPTGDKPADQPASGQPDSEDKPTKDVDGQAAQPPDDKTGQEPGDKGQPADASAAQQADDKAGDDDPLKATYKVVTPEGARDVPAADLITTYQQFNNLQRQHLHVKPLLDFAKSNDMPMDLVWPIFAKGYATLQEEHARGGPGGQPQPPQGRQDGYQGPYKDADQEKYYAERDPDMHQIVMNQHRVMTDLSNKIQQFTRQGPSPPYYRSGDNDPQVIENQRQEIRTQFRKKVTDWAGQHKDYFKIDDKGDSQVLDAFMIYMGSNYPSWRVSELTEQQMSIAFSGFDPAYYTSFITEQAKSKENEIRQQDRQTFAESNNVRTQAPKLGEQEQEISDLWDAMA